MPRPRNQPAPRKHIKRVAEIAVQPRSHNLGRGRAPAKQVAHLPGVDLKGGEALRERARRDGARGDGHVGAAAAGVEVGAEAHETGDVAGLEARGFGEVEGGDGDVAGGGGVESGGGGAGRGNGGGAEGKDGGDEEGEELHFGWVEVCWTVEMLMMRTLPRLEGWKERRKETRRRRETERERETKS